MNQATFLATLAGRPPTAVLRLPANQVGRDFVIGDIHGAFDVVYEALALVEFDPRTDRLFCVGDLVDRGPQSDHCREFLAQDCVHAIRGNHEQVLLNLHAHGKPSRDALLAALSRYEGEWWLELALPDREALLSALRCLPVAIEVETETGLIAMVHGDVPSGMSWPDFCADLEVGRLSTVITALEGRDRLKTQDCSGVAGVKRLFVGHTTVAGGPRVLGNVWAIDTGAVLAQKRGSPAYAATLLELTATEADLQNSRLSGTGRRTRLVERTASTHLHQEQRGPVIAMRA